MCKEYNSEIQEWVTVSWGGMGSKGRTIPSIHISYVGGSSVGEC